MRKELVEEYQRIFKKVYGQDISFEEAREQGENLVRFFTLLLQIDKRSKGREQHGKINDN